MAGEIRRVTEGVAYENRFVRVYDDAVEFGDGTPGHYLRIVNKPEGCDGVVVVARHHDLFALVRTYRYPIGAFQWAFPRGFATGADILETARTELREELGGESEEMVVIGRVTPDSGLLGSGTAVVLAELASASASPEDRREVAEVAWVSEDELRRRIRDGEIEDAFTISAYTLFTVR